MISLTSVNLRKLQSGKKEMTLKKASQQETAKTKLTM